MTPRTVSPAPLNDRRMRRLVLARLHRDAGGSDELFLFGQAVLEAVNKSNPQTTLCSRCSDERPHDGRHARGSRGNDVIREDDRVPFPEFTDFAELTRRTLAAAEEVGGIYAGPLRLLSDCRPIEWLAREQERGATFKQLASIGHAVGMDGAQRGRWYEIAKSVPLSQRHAGHIISKLKGCG
jgi:hypothetical protein